MQCASASPPIGPATGQGSIGIRLVGVPGASTEDPLASSYVVDRVAPGTTLTRQVEIDNATAAAVDVAVYPAAASIVRDSFAFAPSHSGNELSSWTSVGRDLLHLAPGTKTFDTLTVTVPSTASASERYAVLWAE